MSLNRKASVIDYLMAPNITFRYLFWQIPDTFKPFQRIHWQISNWVPHLLHNDFDERKADCDDEFRIRWEPIYTQHGDALQPININYQIFVNDRIHPAKMLSQEIARFSAIR
jgi:hypothetical protein